MKIDQSNGNNIMISTIIFDLGNVIVSDAVIFYKNELADFTDVLKLAGVSRKTAEKIWKKHWPDLKYGRKEINVFWNEFEKEITTKVPIEKIKKAYEDKIIVDKEVLDFAHSLKSKYKILALANESKFGIRLKERKFNLKKTFDKIYCSADLGMAKPNLDIFEFVLKDANLKPGEIIFIDNQIENVEAARSLGIKSIHYVGLKELKKELRLFQP